MKWKGIEKWDLEWRHFATSNVPAFSGISGGRTSALMAILHTGNVTMTFQNTGREHPKTYEFLDRLDHALGKKITWLEWRPPKTKGAPPREFRYEIVNYKTADRTGAPFRGFMEALADYRRIHKGLGTVSPWALARICTAYMKQKTQEIFVRSKGIEAYDSFVGLRADEPDRVSKLRSRETQSKAFRCPLYEAGITKADVLEFWSKQKFDLELEDHQGNCTACFLKDQADIARVLGEEETDADWWLAMERDFDRFGGESFPGYKQLLTERPVRLDIEKALRSKKDPVSDGTLDPRRFRLVVLQEKRRFAGERTAFSCNCESSDETDIDAKVCNT